MENKKAAAESREVPGQKCDTRPAQQSLSVEVRRDPTGACEVTVVGPLTEQQIRSIEDTAESIFADNPERVYVDLMETTQIDDMGIAFIRQLMKQIDNAGIAFQILYTRGRVGKKIENAGLPHYFAQSTWSYR